MGLIPTFSNGLHWYIYHATETKLLCLRNTHTHTWWTSFKSSVDYYIKIIGLSKWYCPKSVNMKLYVFTAEITSELTQDFNDMLKVGMLLGMDPDLAIPFSNTVLIPAWKTVSLPIVLLVIFFLDFKVPLCICMISSERCLLSMTPSQFNESKPIVKLPSSFQGWIITWESQIGTVGCSLFQLS